MTVIAFNILGCQLADWTAIARHGQTPQSCEMRAGVVTCSTTNDLTTGLISL